MVGVRRKAEHDNVWRPFIVCQKSKAEKRRAYLVRCREIMKMYQALTDRHEIKTGGSMDE